MSVITISGNLGSGAIDIGRAVAKKLDMDYVDREILAEAARTLGVSMAAVANRDERTPHFRERLASFFRDFLERSAAAGATDPMMGTSSLEMLMATTYGEAAALPPRGAAELSDARYKEAITSIMNDLAERGDVVIIGRGSQAILKDRPACLHVCTTAPFDQRAQRIAARDGITNEAAKRCVQESDRGRIDYHRKYFKIDPTDPNHYDLTVNTEHLSEKQAAELIVAAYRRRLAGSQ